MKGPSRKRIVVFKLVFVLGSLLAALLLLEIALHIFGPVSLTRISAESVRLSENPDLMYELVPSVLDHNSVGFRDREYPLRKPPGVLRVAALGDSMTYGHGVKLEETFPKLLELLLNDRGHRSTRGVEVLNFGVPGYSIIQEHALLEHRILDYDPDLVVLLVCMNDWQPYTIEFGELLKLRRGPQKELVSSYYDPANSLLQRLLFRSQIYRHIKFQLLKRQTSRKMADKKRGDQKQKGGANDPVKRHYEDGRFYRGYFERLYRTLKGRGIGLIVVLVPYAPDHPEFESGEPYHQRREELSRYCAKPTCRLVLPFGTRRTSSIVARRDQAQALFVEDQIHLNPAGHRLVAEAVLPLLKSELARLAGR